MPTFPLKFFVVQLNKASSDISVQSRAYVNSFPLAGWITIIPFDHSSNIFTFFLYFCQLVCLFVHLFILYLSPTTILRLYLASGGLLIALDQSSGVRVVAAFLLRLLRVDVAPVTLREIHISYLDFETKICFRNSKPFLG